MQLDCIQKRFLFKLNFVNILIIGTHNCKCLSVLDYSVFVGARSDINETRWVLTNGALVDYPPSNRSICQQMSWPLTYDDGKNLLPKHCEQDEAYFACVQQC